MGFEGKTALVTGAAVGIGRACALRFAEEGANVVAADVNPGTLAALREELGGYGDRILTAVCDVGDRGMAEETAKKALDRFGRVDILVNNAALWRSWASFQDTPLEEWEKFFRVNVMGTVYFTKALIGQMIENRWGRIVNVASVAGVYGNANMAHYSATKGAVISFTKALAKEVADKGVTVNAVSPGSVSPSDQRDVDYFAPSELSFMGRTGTDRENADLILVLAGEQAGYISGQNIQIDGCRRKQ